MKDFEYIYDEIREEREHQNRIWGIQRHDMPTWAMILMEEVGEVSKAVLESELLNYRNELIQVAAVACAALESLDSSLNMKKVS